MSSPDLPGTYVFDGQTNLVNVRMAQRTRTLLFAGNDGSKTAKDLLQ